MGTIQEDPREVRWLCRAYNWSEGSSHERGSKIELNLKSLRVSGGGSLAVTAPLLLEVDRESMEVIVVDVGVSGAKLIFIPFDTNACLSINGIHFILIW